MLSSCEPMFLDAVVCDVGDGGGVGGLLVPRQ